MLYIKEHHQELAKVYRQVSKDFVESHNLPMSGRYYERANHEEDVAKEPPFRVLPSVKPFNTKFRYYRYLKTLH